MSRTPTTVHSRRDALKWAALAGAAAFLPGRTAMADEPAPASAPQGSGFYRLKVGELACALVSDGSFAMDPAMLLPKAGPEAIEAAARAAFVSAKQVPVQVNAFVIDAPGGAVLVDTGCGDAFGPATGRLAANLARLGIAPEKVRTVVLSHAHGDHSGGLSAFPAAEIAISEAEHAFWTGTAEMPRSLLAADMRKGMTAGIQAALAAVKGRLRIVKPDAEIAPGISLVPASGHTPGHVAVRIASGADTLLYLSDVLHLPALQLVHPDWHVSFDVDPAEAAATRAKILDMAAADRLRLSGSHLPFPSNGHLTKAAGGGYGWVPGVWEW